MNSRSPVSNPALAREVNLDGIVGPTHNFAGLSAGNLASKKHGQQTSYPRQAALEGLAKMRAMIDLGIPQAVLPPHERPSLPIMNQLGFTGTLADAVADLARSDPAMLATVSSASAMWAANAATVSPSADTADGRVHLTPANLSSTLHRSFEGGFTRRVLGQIFNDPDHFVVHDPLPMHQRFADEGAANHGRFAPNHGDPGLELFVYGRDDGEHLDPSGFPRRQSRLASQTIAHSHGLDPSRVLLAKQNPAAIDAGAFHNDVVSVANQMVFFSHEQAFESSVSNESVFGELQSRGVETVVVPADQVSLDDAISSYLFNSQLVTLPVSGSSADAGSQGRPSMVLIAPAETAENPRVRDYLDELVRGPSPIDAVRHVDVRQSMSNGGGPACLRLRVVLSKAEELALGGSVMMDHDKLDQLEAWVKLNYREQLQPDDLADPNLLLETQTTLDQLTQILDLGSLYHFQQADTRRNQREST